MHQFFFTLMLDFTYVRVRVISVRKCGRSALHAPLSRSPRTPIVLAVSTSTGPSNSASTQSLLTLHTISSCLTDLI